jgi:alkylation response protein AidB-like acyl-CoA dehydrogenase
MAVTEASTTDEQVVVQKIDQLLAEHDPKTTDAAEFLGAQFDLGLAWVHFPEGNGGLGLSPKLQKTINERLTAAGAPQAYYRNPIGHGMSAPTIVMHGSEDQKQRYLRPLFTGEEIWCQLFSEPGAGSDVAGLSSRAVRDGDEWIINGQKVWTTLAHVSRYGTLVVRTDPEQPKHKGLTHFVVDMQAPGVEVRPLRQMTGDAEFNEVYFTDARIPDSERLDAVGDLARKDKLMKLWCDAEVNRLTNIRAGAARKVGTPGPEGSVGKLAFAETNKRIYEYVMELLGADGMLYGNYTMERSSNAMDSRTLQQAFLRSRANSIEGGTSEVMRNILGERVLGLPGDIRVDKELPWSKVPRS